jgi:hypothetical protein
VAGKTPDKAVRAFTRPLQEALVCFADGKVTTDCYDPGENGVLTFNRAEPTQLAGPAKIHVSIQLSYRIVPIPDSGRGPWKVTTTGWIYNVLDAKEARIVAYHWHPISDSHAKYPHVHITEVGDKKHFPTGRVLVEDVLTLAIDLGAEPRNESKWAKVSESNRTNFALSATWGIGHPTIT